MQPTQWVKKQSTKLVHTTELMDASPADIFAIRVAVAALRIRERLLRGQLKRTRRLLRTVDVLTFRQSRLLNHLRRTAVALDNRPLSDVCCICYDSTDERLACGHVVHGRCMHKWALFCTHQATCPTCREPVKYETSCVQTLGTLV